MMRLITGLIYLLLVPGVARSAEMPLREVVGVLFKAAPGSQPDFSHKDLSSLDLSGLDFKRARLAGANLLGADLSGANLSGADLSGAKLDRTRLARANFSGANLVGASFYHAGCTEPRSRRGERTELLGREFVGSAHHGASKPREHEGCHSC